MNLVRQLLSFGAVGVLATIAHVSVAWMLIGGTDLNHYAANLLGTCTAFIVSFFGNAQFTFQTNRSKFDCAKRYFFVSLSSLIMTSSILLFVERHGLPTYAYALLVVAIVPAVTFLLAKLWAFGMVEAKSR